MRIISAILAGAVLAVVPSVAAYAQAPDSSAWWNEFTVGGSALPLPSTADGDLHIATTPAGAVAFAAVRFTDVGNSADASLKLLVRPNSLVGTPQLLACPTTDPKWQAGGDQPWDARPNFSCAGRSATGILSSDGRAVTFLLDARLQTAAFGYDVVLVPDPTSTTPFSVDFVKPGATALIASPSHAPPKQSSTTAPRPRQPVGASSGDGVGQGSQPQATAGLTPPLTAAPSGPQPLPPALAGPTAGTSTVRTRGIHRESPRARAVAAVLLGDLCAYFLWTLRRKRRLPTLIGGRATRSAASTS